MDNDKYYCVVELTQESNEEKVLNDTHIFSTCDNALAFLYHRFCRVSKSMTETCGVFTADFYDDGNFVCVNKNGDSVEGYVSAGLTEDAKMRPAYLEEYRLRQNA